MKERMLTVDRFRRWTKRIPVTKTSWSWSHLFALSFSLLCWGKQVIMKEIFVYDRNSITIVRRNFSLFIGLAICVFFLLLIANEANAWKILWSWCQSSHLCHAHVITHLFLLAAAISFLSLINMLAAARKDWGWRAWARREDWIPRQLTVFFPFSSFSLLKEEKKRKERTVKHWRRNRYIAYNFSFHILFHSGPDVQQNEKEKGKMLTSDVTVSILRKSLILMTATVGRAYARSLRDEANSRYGPQVKIPQMLTEGLEC